MSWQLLIQQALCTYQSVQHHHPENCQPVFNSWCSIRTPTVRKYLPFNMIEQPRRLALPWPCQLNHSGITMHRTVKLICCCTIHSLFMIMYCTDELHLGTNNLNLLKCKNVKAAVYFFVWVIFPQRSSSVACNFPFWLFRINILLHLLPWHALVVSLHVTQVRPHQNFQCLDSRRVIQWHIPFSSDTKVPSKVLFQKHLQYTACWGACYANSGRYVL